MISRTEGDWEKFMNGVPRRTLAAVSEKSATSRDDVSSVPTQESMTPHAHGHDREPTRHEATLRFWNRPGIGIPTAAGISS